MKQHLYRTSATSEQSLKRNLLASVSSKELVPDLSKNAYQVSFLYHNKEHLHQQLTERLYKPITTKTKKKICTLFTGQGSQYPAMGKILYEQIPLIKKHIDKYAQILKQHTQIDYLPCLIENTDLVNQTMYTQPAIVMLQLALDRLWKELGIHSHIYIGHSVGEFSAAASVGYYQETDILRLIAKRASLMQSLETSGGMIAVRSSKEKIKKILKSHNINLDFAAFNAPEQVVLSGSTANIDEIHKECKKQKIKSRILSVSHPFHSQLMNPMTTEFYEFSQSVQPHNMQASGDLISNLTGRPLYKPQSANYWVRHILSPVNFEESVHYLSNSGAKTFIEIGPDAVLSKLAKKCIGESNSSTYLSTMVKSVCPVNNIIKCALELDNCGYYLNWNVLMPLLIKNNIIWN